MYITGFSVTLLLVFYCPLAILVLRKIWPRLPAELSNRVPATMILALILAAIPLWDVTLTTIKMAELCPKAGLFVKRSVKVDGYYTNLGSPSTLKRGFKYIESQPYGDQIIVYTQTDNSIKEEKFDAKTYQVKSQYESIYEVEVGAVEGRQDIGFQKSVVRDRETKEVLGYALRYAVFPGWVDRNTIGLIGMVGWACAKPDQDTMLEYQALLPK
mgnify:CR=1 FL=1